LRGVVPGGGAAVESLRSVCRRGGGADGRGAPRDQTAGVYRRRNAVDVVRRESRGIPLLEGGDLPELRTRAARRLCWPHRCVLAESDEPVFPDWARVGDVR